MYNFTNEKAMKEAMTESCRMYAEHAAKTDPRVAAGINSKDKSFEKCADWIYRMAMAVYIHANGKKNGGMYTTSNDDYAQVVHYFTESNADLEAEIKGIKPKETTKPTTTKADTKPTKTKETKPTKTKAIATPVSGDASSDKPATKTATLIPNNVSTTTEDDGDSWWDDEEEGNSPDPNDVTVPSASPEGITEDEGNWWE